MKKLKKRKGAPEVRWTQGEIVAIIAKIREGFGIEQLDAASSKMFHDLASEMGKVDARQQDPNFRRGWLDCYNGLELCETCKKANAPEAATPEALAKVAAEIEKLTDGGIEN